MVTKVVHCKQDEYDLYIGRPSKWGNPFVLGRDGTREEVIQKYSDWVVKQPHLMDSLHELKDKTLGCYCKPFACHGDILARLADVDDEMAMIVGKKYFLDFKDPNYPCRCSCHHNRDIMHCVPCCYDQSYAGEGTLIEIINDDWFIFSRPGRCDIKLHKYSVRKKL